MRFLLLALLLLAFAPGAAADENLTSMLVKGPMARVDVDKAGKFDAVVAVVDIDVPATRLWSVLLDYPNYRFFMPRVSDVGIGKDADGNTLVKWDIDTPLVRTRYDNAMTVESTRMFLVARTVSGDMSGSHYDWKVIPLGDKRCRLIHSSWPRNMASIVDTLDDKQQTLTIGVAVSSVMATVRALKVRAEMLERQSPTPAP